MYLTEARLVIGKAQTFPNVSICSWAEIDWILDSRRNLLHAFLRYKDGI